MNSLGANRSRGYVFVHEAMGFMIMHESHSNPYFSGMVGVNVFATVAYSNRSGVISLLSWWPCFIYPFTLLVG